MTIPNTLKVFTTILLFLGQSSIAQQSINSKILTLLNKQIKFDNLYFQPSPSILQRFEHNIVSQESNVHLSLEDESRFRYSNNRINFEKVVKAVSKDILFFNKFLPDSIFFYFNDNQLNKCVFIFTIKKDENETISKLLTQQLGSSSYSSSGNRGGPYWKDKAMQLNLVLDSTAMTVDRQKSQNKFRSVVYGETSKPISFDKGSFILEFEMFEQKEAIEPQKSKHEILESTIKDNREGKGNGTFVFTLAKLEGIIKSNTSLKQLESHFGEWNSYSSDNHLGYEWDDKTKDHTIPFFQVQYSTTLKNRNITLRTEVSPTLSSRIKYLEVIIVLNGIQLAEFKQSLAKANYLVNENLTSIFKKQTWQNKAKNLIVTIKTNANGTYSIGVR